MTHKFLGRQRKTGFSHKSATNNITKLSNPTFSTTAEDSSKHLKLAAGLLNYPMRKGIPVECDDTHSLQGGGANALVLSGYSEIVVQKWDDGRVPRSRSTFGRSWQTILMACPRQ